MCCLFSDVPYTFLSHCREFVVDSLNFPGQVHKWRLTQLLQKGSLRAHSTMLDVRATMELFLLNLNIISTWFCKISCEWWLLIALTEFLTKYRIYLYTRMQPYLYDWWSSLLGTDSAPISSVWRSRPGRWVEACGWFLVGFVRITWVVNKKVLRIHYQRQVLFTFTQML